MNKYDVSIDEEDKKNDEVNYLDEEDDFFENFQVTELTMLSLNMNRISNKMSLFEQFLHSLSATSNKKFKIDIIFISETFLVSGEESFCNLRDYHAIHQPRKGRMGGGIVFFVNKKFQIEYHENVIIDENQFLFLKIKSLPYIFCGVYRPPHTSVQQFLKKYDELLSTRKNMICMGDFNINVMSGRNSELSSILQANTFSIGNNLSEGRGERKIVGKK